MDFDSNYGIIIDSLSTITSNYLSDFKNVFSDATDADSPTYVIASITAKYDNIIQQALQTLWNSQNRATANGLGLDIINTSISNLYRKDVIPSTCVITFTVNLSPGGAIPTITSLTIPVTWAVTSNSVNPTPTYYPTQSHTYTASGTYSIIVTSTDITTNVPSGALNTASTLGGYVSSVSNAAAAILGSPRQSDAAYNAAAKYYINIAGQSYYGLEKAILSLNIAALRSVFVVETIDVTTNRGATVYLEYPATQAGGTFDLTDINLQNIATAVYDFHTFGTNTYSGGTGATLFPVQTPYGGYTSSVYLTPMQLARVGVSLDFIYNENPYDAGFNGQVFPLTQLATLRSSLVTLINNYFRSKTLPSDILYDINELRVIIQNTYVGLVDLRNFFFTTYSPTTNNLVYIRRPIGYTYNLADADFTFNAIIKESA
jgi:hypothetical protein